MIDYNFINNYSDLNTWNESEVKQEKENLEALKINKKLYNLAISIKGLSANKILYYPSTLILTIILILTSISIPFRININRLETIHKEYVQKISKISSLKQQLNSYIDELVDHESIYASSSQAFLFAYFLQKSTPNDVELKEYLVDKDGFFIKASGSSIKSINKMLTLLVESPLIRSETLLVKRIITQSNAGSSIMNNTNPSLFEITGKIKPLSLKSRISHLKSSYNYGYSSKLVNYQELINLFNIEK